MELKEEKFELIATSQKNAKAVLLPFKQSNLFFVNYLFFKKWLIYLRQNL